MARDLFPDEDALAALCWRHRIRRLSLFGSTLKGTNRPDSDVDLLVEFEPGRKPGLLGLVGIEAELSALLGGRPVDLRTARDLSPYFRDQVVRTAEVQYEVISLPRKAEQFFAERTKSADMTAFREILFRPGGEVPRSNDELVR